MKWVHFLFISFAVLDSAKQQRCFSRTESKKLRLLMMENECSSPKEQMIKLPVPTGFQYVTPSMQKVRRCDNLICTGKDKGCKPTETQRISISVEAVRVDRESEEYECTKVEVEEHLECECQCATNEEDCSEKQEFDEHTCSCNCKKEFYDWCAKSPYKMMWVETSCQCEMDPYAIAPLGQKKIAV